MLLRAEAFRAVGGFDASLFAHMEEIDLCWRMRRLGWHVGHTSRSVVYHVGGGTLGYGSPGKTYLNFRNSLIVLTKNLRTRSLTYRLIRRFTLDNIAALKFLFEGHGPHAAQVIRAHWHFTARLPALLRERRHLRATDDQADLTGQYRRSVAFDRFILGHKRFSDLDQNAFTGGGAGDRSRGGSRQGPGP
jgi:GT2 family glycosyltransferase